MKSYQATSGGGVDSIMEVERTSVPLDPTCVRVRIEAAALNKRDQWIIEGKYNVPNGQVVVPLCDGCGTIVEAGTAATRFEVGDRVIVTFWPHWVDGEILFAKVAQSFGADLPGTLAEELVVDEQALVLAPRHLSAIEASTIACAGLTAWNALFVRGDLKPGQTVLLLGTGGVSIWALQLAYAAGLRTIVTSSSDEKLARATEMGAAATINYRATPEWQDEVKRLTDGAGVDLVVEVGGKGTIARSIASTRLGGTVVVIGAVSGGEGGVDTDTLIGGAVTLGGIMVGSRAMLEQLVHFIDATGIRPVIDRTFAFEDAVSAYRHLLSGEHFGKVVIEGAVEAGSAHHETASS